MKQIALILSILAPASVMAHSIGEHFHPHLGWEHLLLAFIVGGVIAVKKLLPKKLDKDE